MAFGFIFGGLLLGAVTCALRAPLLQQPLKLPQIPVVVECKDRHLLISVDLPPSGSEPRFEALDGGGSYPITPYYGAQCGYTYSVKPLVGRAVLRASYFSCHTENQNDEVFTFRFRVIIADQNGKESFVNVSKTCSAPSFPREVTCEENYMEVSVESSLPCPNPGAVKTDFTEVFSVAQRSAIEAMQVMLQAENQQPEVMSVEDAAKQGYNIMLTPGRIVFRSSFGQPHASIETVNDVAVEVIKATVFFRQSWRVVMVDLVAACSLDGGSFDGYRLHWRTPAVLTPLVVGPTPLRTEYIGMGVDGQLVDDQAATDRGYTVTVHDKTVHSSIPYGAEGGVRKSFVMDNVYNELYVVQLAYEQTFVDQSGVKTRQTVVRQMATPPMASPPFSVNQTVPEERIFTVYLGNIPSDVELVSVTLNGQEFSVLTAMQMGYSITRIPQDNNTFAYILRVPFDDSVVKKLYIAEGLFEYSLEIKWTLNIMPQGDAYYHLSSVIALFLDIPAPVFDSMCADNGISFRKEHHEYDYLWDFAIGHYPLTQQLASERGYIMNNDSQTLILDVPLFTIGYVYEGITLEQFYGTFEVLTRNAKTLAIEQSSANRCLFQTTELFVCSPEGVLTVVSDITKAVPSADPARTTLLDTSCRPIEFDDRRVLFSFGLNTCGTRVQIGQEYVTYENEIIFHEVYSTDSKPVITRDAAYRMTIRCIYPVHSTESLFVDWKFKAETPGIGQINDPVKVPPQMQDTLSFQKPTVKKPSVQRVNLAEETSAQVIKKPAQAMAPKKPAQVTAPWKPAQAMAPKKPAQVTAPRKPAQAMAPKKPADFVRVVKWSVPVNAPELLGQIGT